MSLMEQKSDGRCPRWQLVLYYGEPTQRKPVPFFNSFEFDTREDAMAAMVRESYAWKESSHSSNWTKAVVYDLDGVAVASHEVAR